MKIIVAGCNGNIGSYLCDKLNLSHSIFGLGTKKNSKLKSCQNQYGSCDGAVLPSLLGRTDPCYRSLGAFDWEDRKKGK